MEAVTKKVYDGTVADPNFCAFWGITLQGTTLSAHPPPPPQPSRPVPVQMTREQRDICIRMRRILVTNDAVTVSELEHRLFAHEWLFDRLNDQIRVVGYSWAHSQRTAARWLVADYCKAFAVEKYIARFYDDKVRCLLLLQRS